MWFVTAHFLRGPPAKLHSMEPKPWYSNGLRLQCTGCGNCCRNHGEYSFVNLTEVELRAIPQYLGITREEFLDRYCTKEPGSLWTLRMDSPACPFLDADNRCSIYPVRPMQCARPGRARSRIVARASTAASSIRRTRSSASRARTSSGTAREPRQRRQAA